MIEVQYTNPQSDEVLTFVTTSPVTTRMILTLPDTGDVVESEDRQLPMALADRIAKAQGWVPFVI